MSRSVVLRDEAQREFDEAFDWYDGQRPGPNAEFVGEIQAVFDRIAVNPFQYQVAFADIRKAVVRRFPYCIFHRAHDDRVEVIAVFHGRRNPSIWQGRV